jgi:hypothetical protein
MAQSLKPWLSIQDQVDRLQRRGMQISDEAAAAQWLSAVGYYRLSGYWYPFRKINSTGQTRRLSTFSTGTTFAEVGGLYEFDRHFKTLIQSGLERVEVALRSQVGHQLGAIDPLAHTDPAHFRSTFNHVSWRATAPEDVIGSWTLVGKDWRLVVGNKSGATSLGFAVLLKFFEIEGRFPARARRIAPRSGNCSVYGRSHRQAGLTRNRRQGDAAATSGLYDHSAMELNKRLDVQLAAAVTFVLRAGFSPKKMFIKTNIGWRIVNMR